MFKIVIILQIQSKETKYHTIGKQFRAFTKINCLF